MNVFGELCEDVTQTPLVPFFNPSERHELMMTPFLLSFDLDLIYSFLFNV